MGAASTLFFLTSSGLAYFGIRSAGEEKLLFYFFQDANWIKFHKTWN
jgi:hypothetical protein